MHSARRVRSWFVLACMLTALVVATPPLAAQSTAPTTPTTPTPGVATTPPTAGSTTTSTPPTPPATPTLTLEEARAQADGQVPGLQTVYDMTDPGIVYGMLAEGVSAWLATLGGGTDQWGNETGGVYTSAVRPDFVPASLITFLLQYYKDHPTVGLAVGPEGVVAARDQLQQARNEALDDLANQLYTNSVEEAQQAANEAANNAANNSANNSENVPPLNNNDNGNNNNSNNNSEPTTAPAITSVSPASFALVAQATTLTINGSGFSTTAASNQVTLSNYATPLTPASAEATMLTVQLPTDFPASASIGVTVAVGELTSNSINVSAKPSIEQIQPQLATSGDDVQIYGYGFDPSSPGNNTVSIEGGAMITPTSVRIDGGTKKGVITFAVDIAVTGTGPKSLTVSVNGATSDTASVEFTVPTT